MSNFLSMPCWNTPDPLLRFGVESARYNYVAHELLYGRYDNILRMVIDVSNAAPHRRRKNSPLHCESEEIINLNDTPQPHTSVSLEIIPPCFNRHCGFLAEGLSNPQTQKPYHVVYCSPCAASQFPAFTKNQCESVKVLYGTVLLWAWVVHDIVEVEGATFFS